MRIVIVGGSGQVGRAVTAVLRSRGHDAVPVSRSTGVDAYTGAGLADALALADADLAEILADVLTAPATNGIVEAAGPEPLRLDEIGRRLLPGVRVETDPDARPLFGAALPERALVPAPGARLGSTTLAAWLAARR